MPRIAVIGAGYVGLATAAGLASLGHRVVALEIDRRRLASLIAGKVPFHEPGLTELMEEGRDSGRLEFGDDYAETIPSADFAIVAVATPAGATGEPDTQFVFAAVEMLLEHARPGLIIITKSTVPVGTAARIEELAQAAGRPDIEVASNPEFLREGTALDDFLHPDRIVVGAASDEVAQAVVDLYDGIDAPVLVTSRRTAELAKYAANAFLATRISFMNEMAGLSDALGADINDIARIVGSDSRIGPKFLQAGLGWGGSCFPKDLEGLVAMGDRIDRPAKILQAVIEVNGRQRKHAVALLTEAVAGRRDGTVAVLGIAFKPHTDDLRGSPALEVMASLVGAGMAVRAHDPYAMDHARAALPAVHYASNPYEAALGADAVLLATEWPEYLQLDWVRMREAMRGRVIVDGRNVLHAAALGRLGFAYHSYGRAKGRSPRVVAGALADGDDIAAGLARAGRRKRTVAPRSTPDPVS